eukprot:6545081-Lingulodinium_polyedra.AAC.1
MRHFWSYGDGSGSEHAAHPDIRRAVWVWVAIRPDASAERGLATSLSRGGGVPGQRQSNNHAE